MQTQFSLLSLPAMGSKDLYWTIFHFSIFVGRYTIHLGLQGSNLSPCTNQPLDSALDTVGDKMKHAGNDTHLIGKFNRYDDYER